MSNLIDSVLTARAAAEAANPVDALRGVHNREQEAAILIAQVQAIVGGAEPAASEESLAKVDEAAGAKTEDPTKPTTGL